MLVPHFTQLHQDLGPFALELPIKIFNHSYIADTVKAFFIKPRLDRYITDSYPSLLPSQHLTILSNPTLPSLTTVSTRPEAIYQRSHFPSYQFPRFLAFPHPFPTNPSEFHLYHTITHILQTPRSNLIVLNSPHIVSQLKQSE
jgi:hypothetical protein